MANPNPAPQNVLGTMLARAWDSLVQGLPWAKVTGPMIPVIIGDYYIGEYLFKLHQLNLTNNIKGEFPTTNTFITFFVATLLMIAVYLGLSVFHLVKNVKKVT